MKQKSIKSSVSISGIGLHTGELCTIMLNPADENHGIVFKRIVEDKEVLIPADVSRVTETNRSTNITKDNVSVKTIEHLLSALYMSEVQNVLIDIDGSEVPILDGSAKPFYNLIQEAGVVEQKDDVNELLVNEEIINYIDEETGAEYTILPSHNFEVNLSLDYDNNAIGKQYAWLKSIDDYTSNIMSSRTYVLFEELEYLAEQGLIKGGRLDNALIVAKELPSDERIAAVYNHLKRDQPLDLERVRNHLKKDAGNEPSRHKLLDLIGDLALSGIRVQGKIIAYRTGHSSNIRFSAYIKKLFRAKRKLRGKPVYNKHTKTLLDINDISKYLPHRYPFLLVDKIVEVTDDTIVGVKNITMNEPVFQGHFPDNPIFPGVLQVEAMAQVGGLLTLMKMDDAAQYDTYFLKLDQIKFRKKIIPGDVMLLKLRNLGPMRRGIVDMEGIIYVGDEIASEGLLSAQIVKRSNK